MLKAWLDMERHRASNDSDIPVSTLQRKQVKIKQQGNAACLTDWLTGKLLYMKDRFVDLKMGCYCLKSGDESPNQNIFSVIMDAFPVQ